jgi:nucleotide-binding universal stress UspA family protein
MFTRILVPLDGTPEGERALPVAAEIARRFDATVLLLQVTPGYGQVIGVTATEPFGAGAGAMQAAAEVAARAEASASAYLDRLRSEFGSDEWITDIAEGDSAAAIVEAARKFGADLIVMATHARTGLKRLFLGSVADDVIRQAGIPVLVVHREDED